MRTHRLALTESWAVLRRKGTLVLSVALSILALGVCASADDGRIITFDVSGAGTGAGQGTVAQSINPGGMIAGYYIDNNNVAHGFLRSKGGDITTFDVSGAGTGAFQGTLPFGSNPEGAITGYYSDSSNLHHAFVRAPDGNITTFDAPGARQTDRKSVV